MIDFSDVCKDRSFDQWFQCFFIIHRANLRSVKIVQKSGKRQEKVGIFPLLMSGNPVLEQCFTNLNKSTFFLYILSEISDSPPPPPKKNCYVIRVWRKYYSVYLCYLLKTVLLVYSSIMKSGLDGLLFYRQFANMIVIIIIQIGQTTIGLAAPVDIQLL